MEEKEILNKAGQIFEKEGRLIELVGPRVVFVGDTHGDLDATRTVFDKYFDSYDQLVFLGDYVDRGPKSWENLIFLLSKKVESPKKIYLLMGNHEGWKAARFQPADFWTNLSPGKRELYVDTLAKLPYVAHSGSGIIAVHGGLPQVRELEEIKDIKLGSVEWRQITWGDWVEDSEVTNVGISGRPQLGKDHFEEVMDRFQKTVLIRSHQPYAEMNMFDSRCLTIFTSHAYGQIAGGRRVAIADLETDIQSTDDLRVESI